MNEEPSANGRAETTETTAAKQLIDRPSDFRFHAAYLVYSDSWEKATSSDIKLKLNDIVSALSSEKIDYETFYREISQYRIELNPEHFSGGKRTFIETQRKRDWRKREEKDSRNKRHRR
jgi:hypothetical protein